jgi:ribosomal protein L29
MKRDKKQELKSQNIAALQKRLAEIEKEIMDKKMQLKLGSLKNVHEVKTLRKEIAFIKFLISQKNEQSSESQEK